MASNLLYRQFFPPHDEDGRRRRIARIDKGINPGATGWGSKLAFHFVANCGSLARRPGRLDTHQIIKRAAGKGAARRQ